MHPRDISLAILPPLLWAFGYAFAKYGLDHFPPLLFTGLVYAIAAALLWRPNEEAKTSRWMMVLIAALGGAVQSGFVFAGFADLPASVASLAVQLQVPFAVLAAAAICGERLSVARILGIVIAFSGVGLASGIAGGQTAGIYPLLLITLGTLSWGVSQALIRRFAQDRGPLVMALIARYAAPMLLGLSILTEQGQLKAISTADIVQWTSAIVMGLGGFAVAYSIWYGLLSRYRVDQIVPFALLMPPFGILAGWLLFDEAIGYQEILGACIIVGGLWIVVKPTNDSKTIVIRSDR